MKRVPAVLPALLVILVSLCMTGRAVAQSAGGSEPLSLRAAVERAVAHAPALAVSRNALEEANAGARVVASAFQPEASVSSTPGYATGMPVAVIGRVPALFAVEARQLIYDARTRGEVHAAEARAEEASGALAHARAETVRSVVALYARCFANETLLASARRRVETQQAESERAAALEREGRLAPLDTERALLGLARARQTLLDVTSTRDLDEMDLRRLVQWPANEPLVLADDPSAALPEPPHDENLAAALSRDPQLASLRLEADAANQAALMLSRPLQPVVAAAAQYERLARFNNYDDYFRTFKADDFSVGVSITVPLYSGGRNDAGAARARATAERVRADRGAREEALAGAVLRKEAAHASAVSARSLAERARAVSAEGLRIARVLDSEGRGEPEAAAKAALAFSESEEELANATLALVIARAELLSLRGDLYQLLAP